MSIFIKSEMKQQFILWLGAIILTFLIGFARNVTDEYYPVSGTFGIQGQKVSYKLDKVHYGNEPYRIIIISDLKDIKGQCIRTFDGKTDTTDLRRDKNKLIGEIPPQKPLSISGYKIVIFYKDERFEIPEKSKITLVVFGKIPSFIGIMHFILLYSGLLFSVRTALELFNKNKMVKKYIVIASSLFITLTTIITPLRNSYKLGAINSYIPSITELFEPTLIILVLLWIAGTVLIFHRRFSSITVVFLFATTVALFFLLPVV